MRFELSEDQELLRRATRDFLAGACPMEKSRRVMEHEARGYDVEQWRQIAEQGYLGLTVPPAGGGQGLGAIELAVVAEELGRACLPGPHLDVMLAADLLARAGGQDTLLREVSAGTSIVTIARDDSPFNGTAAHATRLERGTLRGRKFFVPFAAEAAALLVTTPDGVALAKGPFAVTALPTLDPGQRFGAVQLEHAATLLGPASLLERTDQLAAGAAGAALLGIMARCLEMTLEYVGTRQAFKKPIGSFQALQHRLADMLLRTESTRSAVYRAAWCVDAGDADTALACAAAKAYAGEASRLVCGEAIQMHGGIGFTWELDLHFYFKRAKTLEQQYGSTEVQLTRAAAAAGF